MPGVAQRVGRGIALIFHDRGTRRGWVVSSTLPPGKTRYPLYRRLGGPQGRSRRAENLVPIGIRSRTVQPVAQSLYRLSYPAHKAVSSTAKYIVTYQSVCCCPVCSLSKVLLILITSSTNPTWFHHLGVRRPPRYNIIGIKHSVETRSVNKDKGKGEGCSGEKSEWCNIYGRRRIKKGPLPSLVYWDVLRIVY